MKRIIIAFIVGFSILGFKPAQATALEELLISKLDIKNEQAAAGVGIVLNYLKGKLNKDDYATVAEGIGDETYYMREAESAKAFKKSKSLTKGLGKSAQNVSAPGLLGETSKYFSNIGIKSDKIGNFFNTIVQYLKDKGSDKAVDILSNIKI